MAPAVMLEVRPIGLLHVLDQLDSGGVDLALSTLTDGGDRFKCVGLLADDYVVILSTEHLVAAEAELSVERFAGLPHVISTSGDEDTNFVDEALAARGLARHVAVKVPLHSLIFMLIGSKSIAAVPRRVAADIAAIGPLTMRAAAVCVAAACAVDDLASPAGQPPGASLAARHLAGNGCGRVVRWVGSGARAARLIVLLAGQRKSSGWPACAGHTEGPGKLATWPMRPLSPRGGGRAG